MQEKDHQVPTLYPVNLDTGKANVSFGIPNQSLQGSIYADSDYELLRFLDYGQLTRIVDIETVQTYKLLRKNISGEYLFDLFQSAEVALESTVTKMREIFGDQVNQALTPGNFWRFLVDFPDAEAVGLEHSQLRLLANPKDSHGPHAKMEHRDKHAIIRVKASTLTQLQELFSAAELELV